MTRATTTQVARALGVPQEVARGFVRFLLEKDLVRPVDLEKRPDGKGAALPVYDFGDHFERELLDALAPLTRPAP